MYVNLVILVWSLIYVRYDMSLIRFVFFFKKTHEYLDNLLNCIFEHFSQIWEIHLKVIADTLLQRRLTTYLPKRPIYLVLVLQFLNLHRNWSCRKMVICGIHCEVVNYPIILCHVSSFNILVQLMCDQSKLIFSFFLNKTRSFGGVAKYH